MTEGQVPLSEAEKLC